MTLKAKYKSLKEIIKGYGKVAVAYSGGVDSTLLLKVAVDVLGAENVLACIGTSASLAESQKALAMESAKGMGVKVFEVAQDELDDVSYSANKSDRCFHCKSHLYESIIEFGKKKGFEHFVCGSNFDDLSDYRPGNRAAEVFGVAAPMAEYEMAKEDIRALSRELGLATADVPASPCLASRVSYGLEITEKRLGQIEAAEEFLRGLGFVEFRVRHHGDIGRVEVKKDDIEKAVCEPNRTQIVEKLKSLGFKFVALDLQGFRSGALNETLSEKEKNSNS